MRISISRTLLTLAGIMIPLAASADTFNLSNIDLGDFNALINEFSANSQYSTVTPASSLGGLWGFELGVVGGMTKAPDTLALVKRNSPTTSLSDKLYHAGVLGRLGLPYGLTAEALYIPKIKVSEAHLGRWGLGAQWTLTDSILEDIPLNIAAKLFYTKTTLDFSQNITSSGVTVPATINLDNHLWGLMALFSYKIFVFEPYLGIGYTKAKGTINVDAAGSATIFNQAVFGAGTKSVDSSPSSSQFLLGLDFRLGFFSLGAEYDRAFGKDSYNGRLSFRF